MNDTLKKAYSWINKFKFTNGEPPEVISLTIDEILDVLNDTDLSSKVSLNTKSNSMDVFGISVEEVPYAPDLRQRRLEVPVTTFVSESPLNFIRNSYYEKDCIYNLVKIHTSMLCDKTTLIVEFEWDIFANLKRKLHLTKWFPIKKAKVKLNCMALYPYIKVQLPHNRHCIRFEEVNH